jgi:hypothetical protein
MKSPTYEEENEEAVAPPSSSRNATTLKMSHPSMVPKVRWAWSLRLRYKRRNQRACQHVATMHQRLPALAWGTREDPSLKEEQKVSGNVEPRSVKWRSGHGPELCPHSHSSPL